MTHVLKINTPIPSKKKVRTATVTIKKSKKNGSVYWSMFSFDNDAIESNSFKNRLNELGFMESVKLWFDLHRESFCHETALFGSNGWGHVKHMPLCLVDDFASLIYKNYEIAAAWVGFNEFDKFFGP